MPHKSIIVIAIAALLPLLVLAFFNQPAGDDMWYTWMAKQYGFREVQHQWFITINGRYLSNMVMSLNSWIYGSVWWFKTGPAVVILLWPVVVYTWLKGIPGTALRPAHRWAAACLFVLVYYLHMPGLYEGVYWMSAVTGYQLPLLLYLCCWRWISSLPSGAGWKPYVLALLLFVAGGFHEVITLCVCILLFYVVLIRHFLLRRPVQVWLMALAASGLALLTQLLSIGNQYKANTTGAEVVNHWHIGRILQQSVLQTGYHITVHCLLSPLYWFLLGMAWCIGYNGVRPFYQPVLSFKKNGLLIAGVLVPLTFLPGLPIVYLYSNVAPLRIMNLAYFIWLSGSVAFVALAGVYGAGRFRLQPLVQYLIRKNRILLPLALCCMMTLAANERRVVTVLANGGARQYNQEVQVRLQQIQRCRASVCTITCLAHQPAILCPVDVCQDTILLRHLEKVVGKKLKPTSLSQ